MKYNYSKLLGAIKEKTTTQSNFASKLGMSERSLSLKLNNKRMWKQDEIIRACHILSIPYNQICVYFFTQNVQKNEQKNAGGISCS